MVKIYTKKGDRGETSLLKGKKVRKNNLRLEVYGTIDELGSFLGLVWDMDVRFEELQCQLFTINSYLADPKPGKMAKPVRPEDIRFLEKWIDEVEAVLPPLNKFILPGGSLHAVRLHLCRTVCRRAERALVSLSDRETVDKNVLIYINRLSDLFFVLARFANLKEGIDDVIWRQR